MAVTVLNRLEVLRNLCQNFPLAKDKKLVWESQVLSADGAITIKNGTVVLDKAGAVAATLAAPTSGTDDGGQIEVISASAQAHTVTCPAGNGTINGASNIATFASNIGNGIVLIAYQGKWLVRSSVNITLSGT